MSGKGLEPEKRQAKEDGMWYTRKQFLEYYKNGEEEWAKAKSHMAVKEDAPSNSNAAGPPPPPPLPGASPSHQPPATPAGFTSTAPAGPAQAPERRIDSEDGNPYTFQEFVDCYGNEAPGWVARHKWMSSKPESQAPQTAHTYDPVAGGAGGAGPPPPPPLPHEGAAPPLKSHLGVTEDEIIAGVNFEWFVELNQDDMRNKVGPFEGDTAGPYPGTNQKKHYKPIFHKPDIEAMTREFKKPTNRHGATVRLKLGRAQSSEFELNFHAMTQRNPSTGRVRTIKLKIDGKWYKL